MMNLILMMVVALVTGIMVGIGVMSGLLSKAGYKSMHIGKSVYLVPKDKKEPRKTG